MKITVTYIVSNIDKALTFEWAAELLDKEKLDLSFILLNPGDSALEQHCKRLGVPVWRITYRSKKDLPWAFIRIWWYLLTKRPRIVHCHLFDGYLIGIPAAWCAFVCTRIYTRHNATYHRDYYPNMVRFDNMANQMASVVVATTENVKRVLMREEGVPEHKIRTIHYGFELEKFINPPQYEIDELAAKYGTKEKYPVVGLIARYLDLKGLQYAIPAWLRLRKEYPRAHLILANSRGPYGDEVRKMLTSVSETDYTEISFEKNIYALHHLFDIHVHTPINPEIEAFGQTYVEALASSTPSVFTMSGVAREFIRHERNALVVDFENSEQIYEAMKRFLMDKQLGRKLASQGKQDVQCFGVGGMISKLEALYLE